MNFYETPGINFNITSFLETGWGEAILQPKRFLFRHSNKNFYLPVSVKKKMMLDLHFGLFSDMKYLFILFFIGFGNCVFAQSGDSLPQNKVVVFKDYRLNILARKEAELNAINYKRKPRMIMGYRLMVLNTNDKDYAFKIRAELLKKFPEQKPYMWYSNPYIRIKFGDFKTKEEADVYKKQISDMLGGANIYYIEEPVEIGPDVR